MKLLSHIIAVFIIIWFLTSGSSAQGNGQQLISELPSKPSFEISVGRTFDASRPTKIVPSEVPKTPSSDSIVSDIAEAISVVQKEYAGKDAGRKGKVTSSMLNEMLRKLDPHSRYYSAEEFSQLKGEHNSEYSGTGLTIAEYSYQERRGVYILGTARSTTARATGLRFGDRIVEVDGVNVEAVSVQNVRDRIRGSVGTTVRLKVEQGSTGAMSSVELPRKMIHQDSIRNAFMIDSRMGYIGVNDGFSFFTAAEFGLRLLELKEAGARSLVIDLRGNGGGVFEQAVEIAEHFLEKGETIVLQQGRVDEQSLIWRSSNKCPETLPLIILVDEETASASEIFAAAMQDNDRAYVVGGRTFGKGLVQDVIEMPDASGLTLTSARYFAPTGRSIQREYSDGHLYDYYMGLDRGSIVESSLNAFRTRKGRVVYGGNGIKPDRTLVDEITDPDDAKAFVSSEDRAFFQVLDGIREGARSAPSSPTKANDIFLAQFADMAKYGLEVASQERIKTEVLQLISQNDLKAAATMTRKSCPAATVNRKIAR